MILKQNFPYQIFNSFTRAYFDLQSNFSRDPIFKPDFYTIEEYLKNIPEIYQSFSSSGNAFNKDGSRILNQFISIYDEVRSFSFKKDPFIAEVIELKFKRENEVIKLGEEISSGLSYIKERPLLTPSQGIVNVELENYKLISSQKPNALLFDIIDVNGNSVKISKIKQAQNAKQDQISKVFDIFNPRTLETKGLIPLVESTPGLLNVEIETLVPIKINRLEPVISLFDKIALAEETLSFDTPRKGVSILGYAEDDEFGKLNFDLEVIIKVEEQEYSFRNIDEVLFGRGHSSEKRKFLNIDSPINEFDISFNLIKKDSIKSNQLLDHQKLMPVSKYITKEELKNGIPTKDLYGNIELGLELNSTISQLKAQSIGTSTEMVLSEDYRLSDNLALLRISDGTNTLSLSDQISDTSFIIDNIILRTNNQNEKIAWFENEYLIERDNGRIKVLSKIDVNNLVLNNNKKLFKKEKVYRYKDFKKFYKNIVKIPLEKEIDDLRVIINKTPIQYSASTNALLPSENTYLIKDKDLLVYIPEASQAFASISVYGEDVEWRKISGSYENGYWYFDIPTSISQTSVNGDCTLGTNVIQNTVNIPGYYQVDHHNAQAINNLRLRVSSSASGTNYFNIPYTPYSNLSFLSEGSYGTSSSHVWSTSTATHVDVSFLALPKLDVNKMYWIENKQISFYEEPSNPVTITYETLPGYLNGNPILPLEFYIEDNLIKAEIETSKKIYLKYFTGTAEDLIRFPNRVVIKVEGLSS